MLALALVAGSAPVHAGDVAAAPSTLTPGNNPNFDSVTFLPLACNNGVEPQGDENPASADLVGDASHPAVYYAWDNDYVYFRFRVDAMPSGPRGFDQYAWVALLQVPSGDPFQYQYELSLNGKSADDDFGNTSTNQGDTIEIWQNTAAIDIAFSPNFKDPAELRLFAQRNDYAGPTTVNTTPLARIIAAGDGSNFGGSPDYFVDVAFPVSVLIAKGVISGASDLAGCLFYPATSTNANQYNKDHLDCPFLPYTALSITKSVSPAIAPANTAAPIVHTITVTNSGAASAKGLTISDTAFPASLTGITVHVTSTDPAATWTVVSTNPLSVKVPGLAPGKSVSVEIDSTGSFSCGTAPLVDTATAGASNALEVTAQATLGVGGAAEICDGKDNNCDGQIDEGTGLCDDGNPCNGTETCVAGSCHAGTPMSCGSNNPCVVDSCDPVLGCVHTNKSDGTACNDGNACTHSDSCQAGVCVGANPVTCAPSDQCHDAGICNTSTGICSNPPKANGSACDDGNSCTQSDSCQAGACVGSNPVLCIASDQCHDAGTCDPATGACSNPKRADGASCDDGNACTRTDTCQAGICVGVNPVVCAASDQCHLPGICDPTTGACSNPAKDDGASCDDGDACTQNDTCQAGVCVGSNPVVCTASDQCHIAGTCNPATGACSNPNRANGAVCNDGNACSQTDTCQSGICVGSNAVVCTASDQCHIAGTCDPATGTCSNPAKNDGAGCDDGNACTQTDTCQLGICVGGNPVVCTARDQCHVAGTCDPSTGACSNPNADDATPCNDGDACTQTDTCQSGICVGGNPVVCTASDRCHIAGTCDRATGTCSNPNATNGTGCDDGNACTHTDTCHDGLCVGGNSVTCTASDQCHLAGTCNPANGTCSNPTKADGTSCSDGNSCTQSDTCQAGVCVGTGPVVCTASDECHVAGTCDPATGICSNPPKNNGAPCDDGNACTHTDTCQNGTCAGSNFAVCVATDQCHVAGTCDPATGACSNLAKPDGTACNDGNACTQSDTCQAGVCVGASPVVCTASDQCHLPGTCDTSTGTCSNPAKPNGTSCTDGSACTQTDTCQSGTCVGGNPVVCTASDQCHVPGTCVPTTGACSNPAKSDGTACNDGNPCTQTDTCQSGTCAGTNPVTCAPSDQCHLAGTCNTSTGVCSNPAKPNGASCDDGNACTQADTCQSGTCTGSNPISCTASDQCHVAGTCNPSTGACSNPDKANGSACDDGNPCTSSDTCQSGACVGSNPVVCTASDPCHLPGTCDPSTGTCSNPVKPNGSACSDGNACTQTDTCQGGICTGSNPVTCTASDQCHLAGTCNTSTGVCSNPPKANGVSCDDGSACTRTDTCQSGACTGANPVTCTASDQCHLAGTCTPSTGTCSNPPTTNGSACSDGNACTSNDTCQVGVCTSGAPTNCDDANVCTDDGCDPVTGCWHINNTGPCNDGNQCTPQDTCSNGVCVGGPPSWPDCSSPKTIGFYKRLCSGPQPEDELTQANADCVNDWSAFSSVATVADVCAIMHFDDSNDKCLQAESQLMASLLNVCKHRLFLDEPIISKCGGNTTVGVSIRDANALLSNPGRTSDQCVTAQCETEELNSGRAITWNIQLMIDRTVSGVHVRWYPPTGIASTSYYVWRRVKGGGTWAIIATTPNLFYDDTQIVGGTSYEYQVTTAN